MKESKLKVLFVCVHNSARSQMAEAWVNHLCTDFAIASSAGLEPGTLNPVVVEVMREAGIEISHHQTKSVFDLFKAGHKYNRVITVCDAEAAERCPVFPGYTTRLSWSFTDPSQFTGSWEEKLAETRKIRDDIRKQIEIWCQQEQLSLAK